ncbi:MAG: DNA mismatch repair protein MutS [Candidatus Tectimicrobiota bacterium]|nr:MAG: DNA mismatch repair protein MutS [Candidatus Tectomicrobia bacterium]
MAEQKEATAAASPPRQLTPVMAQYLRLKQKAGDALLLFRLGDFYELFFEDAVVAARALDIVLTSRQKEDPIPMCGVPVHSAEGYIDRLLQQGFKVAICEQLEDPRQAQGLVSRDIVRVITPGTVTSGGLLIPKAHHFLASIAPTPGGAGFAYLDLSTGTFAATAWSEATWQQALRCEFARVQPREVLVPEPSPVPLDFLTQDPPGAAVVFQPWGAEHFQPPQAARRLMAHFAVTTLAGFGCEDNPLVVAAAGALLAYVQETQQQALAHLTGLRLYHPGDFLILDETSQRHLEVFTAQGTQKGSLFDVIDHTVTAMGGRLLRQWLSQPLCQLEPLRERQEAVAELVAQPAVRQHVRQALAAVADVERLVGRLALGTLGPREALALRHSIAQLPAVAAALQPCQSPFLQRLQAQWDALADVAERIAAALVDDPPATVREGGVIRPGYHAELDALRAAGSSGKDWLSLFEAQERQRTGIPSLRVGFNRVFGYYIEVRKSHLAQVPPEYVRKQTLVNAERFITPALKDREVQMLRAEEEALQLEQQLYEALRQELVAHIPRLQRMAHVLSQLDAVAALAEVAVRRQYCRPQLDDSDVLSIVDGRHPTLEAVYQEERFVPNDTFLDRHRQQIVLLTGPNMAGKSTYMRQVALIVLLAQIGSFVPAREARIGLVDRIFTRIGAQDVLTKGRSTFMVEMLETAHILHNMTARSLILLDEIGRGTSTYDGMSIAWAVIEYLHNHGDLRPRTLFATHYHELTALAATLERVRNYNAAVREWGESIVFLRKILEGSADRSYGLHVARLAGLPAAVLERARQILATFEATARRPVGQALEARSAEKRPEQLSLFDDLSARLIRELQQLPVEELSPLAALNKLAELQAMARKLP